MTGRLDSSYGSEVTTEAPLVGPADREIVAAPRSHPTAHAASSDNGTPDQGCCPPRQATAIDMATHPHVLVVSRETQNAASRNDGRTDQSACHRERLPTTPI